MGGNMSAPAKGEVLTQVPVTGPRLGRCRWSRRGAVIEVAPVTLPRSFGQGWPGQTPVGPLGTPSWPQPCFGLPRPGVAGPLLSHVHETPPPSVPPLSGLLSPGPLARLLGGNPQLSVWRFKVSLSPPRLQRS